MGLLSKVVAVMVMGLLVGCDSRPVLTSQKAPLSVGGITLGMSKDELQKHHELLSCSPDSPDKAKCFVDDRTVKYDFFGVPVSFVEIKLHSPYSTVTELAFSIKGGKVRQGDLESAWGIQGKCLSKADIDSAVKFDPQASADFARRLDDFQLLPRSNEDFVCLLPDHSFLKYKQYSDKGQAGVDLYYLDEGAFRSFGYLFRAKLKLAKAQSDQRGLAAPAGSAARAPTPPATGPDKVLLDAIDRLNDRCRGGSGDDPKTHQACAQRPAVMEQAKLLGWCWGPEAATSAERHWIRCE